MSTSNYFFRGKVSRESARNRGSGVKSIGVSTMYGGLKIVRISNDKNKRSNKEQDIQCSYTTPDVKWAMEDMPEGLALDSEKSEG